jgi:hypothetical protein
VPISNSGSSLLLGRFLVETRVDLPTRLRHSEGFVVETPTGRFGTVEGLGHGTHGGTPDCLVVRSGWLGRRRTMISFDDISEVLPRQRLVRLRSRWMTIQA